MMEGGFSIKGKACGAQSSDYENTEIPIMFPPRSTSIRLQKTKEDSTRFDRSEIFNKQCLGQ